MKPDSFNFLPTGGIFSRHQPLQGRVERGAASKIPSPKSLRAECGALSAKPFTPNQIPS